MASRAIPRHLRSPNTRDGSPGRPSSASFSRESALSQIMTVNEKQPETGSLKSRPPGMSFSSTGRAVQNNTHGETAAQNKAAQRKVRTIPAWVQDADEDDVEWHATHNLLQPPSSAFVAHHNHTPSSNGSAGLTFARPREPDSYFTAAPGPLRPRQSRWVTFAKASAYPPENWRSEKVTPDYLNEHFGDYSQPWLAGHNEDDVEDESSRYHAFRRKRKAWYKRYQRYVLRHPMIPAIFRITTILFACAALALGGSIHHLSNEHKFPQGPSAEMAIIVDAIAIAYIVYVTWDEYTGKPLGLRSARAKMRLIFLDLFFIVFQSANLALAFESLSDTDGACLASASDTDGRTGNSASRKNDDICSRQRGLASVLLIALITWLLTFAISVLRVVERLVNS